MANGKTQKQTQKCGNTVAKTTRGEIVSGLYGIVKKKEEAGSIPGQPRRFRPLITPYSLI